METESCLARGVKLICAKVVDLITLADKHRLSLDTYTDETRCSHQDWVHSLKDVYQSLQELEYSKFGKRSKVSNAFELLVLTT